jgi:hypothetical protein
MEIQRFTEQLEGSNMVAHKDGEFVDYWDHLRHLTLAKIAVLEEVFNHPHLGLAIAAKLAELRKEFTHE